MKRVLGSLVGGACLIMGGCATPAFYTQPLPLTEQADQFNRAATNAERLMIVRNVMRGRDRSSMLFTRISSMRGSMQRSTSATFGLQIPEAGANDTASTSATLGGQSNPTFDFSVLNDEKFNRAMQSSIDLGVYDLLLEYGWHADLLHTLFIERVEVEERVETPDGTTAIAAELFINDPSRDEQFSRFQAWLRRATVAQGGQRFQLCSRPSPTQVGPLLNLRPDTDLEDLAAIANAKLVLESDDARDVRLDVFHSPRMTDAERRRRLAQARDNPTGPWALNRPGVARWFNYDCEITPDTVAETLGGSFLSEPGAENGLTAEQTISRPPFVATLPAPTMQEIRYPRVKRLYLRSIQGALVYLGEVVRRQEQNTGSVVRVNGDDTLFWIHEGICEQGLNFEHDDGATYSVAFGDGGHCEGSASPATGVDRTHQVISLMLQLIGMIQAREDVPATGAVQVVN